MALTETPIAGAEGFAYYNSATYSSPTWVNIANARDVTINLSANEVETNARASGWKLSRQGLRELSFSFGYLMKQGADTVWDALRAAYFAGTVTEFLFLDADATETGAEGVRAHCQIFSQTINQSLEDAVTSDNECRPVWFEDSATLIVPTWYTAS